MDLEVFQLVLLRRPDNVPDLSDADIARIQQEHLAFHANLRAQGHVVTNGPVLEQPDPSLRGLAFYRVDAVDQARRMAEQDPAVVAGRLVVEVMTWWSPPGTMILPGAPIHIEG